MPQIGDTVTLKVKFYSMSGIPVNVDNSITLTIYDRSQNQVEQILNGIKNVATGEYQYEYTIPDGKSYLVFEYKGEIGGKTALRRGRIPRTWDGE